MRNIFIIGVIVIYITGCKVGPKYKRPETKNPEKYLQTETQTDSITNLQWWEVYNDSALKSLIDSSLYGNLDLREAIARVEEAQAVLGYNRANMGPSFNYSGRAKARDFDNISERSGFDFPGNTFNGTGNVSWELDIWGKIRHANRAAFAELLASEENRKSVYISMIAQIAELYFQLRGLDERLDITRKTFQSRQEYLRIITLRFEKGQVSELDKLQAEQLMADSEAQVYSIEREIIAVENAINILLGKSYAPIVRGLLNSEQQLPLDIPSGIPSELLERRPDIRIAEQQLVAQTERVGVAVALRFPSLSLTGFLGLASPDITKLFDPGAYLGSISGQITGPIFHFGQNLRRVEVERARARQLGFNYERTVLKAFAEVENSLAEIRTYRNEFNARQTQVNATEKTLALSKALYDNGYTSFLQVLDSEREYYTSQYQKSIALQSQLVSTVRLYKALGGGW